MYLGLGLTLSNQQPSGVSYAPHAFYVPPTGITTIDFGWTAGANNTGRYWFDLSTDIAFGSFVGIYNNLQVDALTLTVTGLRPNTVYYARVRASLNVIQRPTLRTSWDNLVAVPWTGGTTDIKDITNGLIAPSATNTYRLIFPPDKAYNEKEIPTREYVDWYIPATTSIGYSHGVGLLQDTLICDGNMQIVGENSIISRTCDVADGNSNYPIHYMARAQATTIIQGINFRALGTLSKNALGVDLNGGAKLHFINCTIHSEVEDGTNIHSEAGEGGSAEIFFWNTTVTLGNPAKVGIRYGTQATIGGDIDFVYINGGNIVSFTQGTSGVGATGEETKIYISDSTICPTKTFANPDVELSLAQFATFLSTNDLSISSNSNVVTATTQVSSYIVDKFPNAVLAITNKQVTAGAGSDLVLREDSGNTLDTFGFVAGKLNQTAITAFLNSANGFGKNWYDQVNTARSAAQTTAGLQPKYVIDGTNVVLQTDGSNDYLQVPESSNFVFLSDFCIVAVLKFNSYNSYQCVLTTANGGNCTLGWWIEFGTDRGFTMFNNNSELVLAINTTFLKTLNTTEYYKIRLQRVSGVVELFIDDVSQGTQAYASSIGNTGSGYNQLSAGIYANGVVGASLTAANYKGFVIINGTFNATDILTLETTLLATDL